MLAALVHLLLLAALALGLWLCLLGYTLAGDVVGGLAISGLMSVLVVGSEPEEEP